MQEAGSEQTPAPHGDGLLGFGSLKRWLLSGLCFVSVHVGVPSLYQAEKQSHSMWLHRQPVANQAPFDAGLVVQGVCYSLALRAQRGPCQSPLWTVHFPDLNLSSKNKGRWSRYTYTQYCFGPHWHSSHGKKLFFLKSEILAFSCNYLGAENNNNNKNWSWKCSNPESSYCVCELTWERIIQINLFIEKRKLRRMSICFVNNNGLSYKTII